MSDLQHTIELVRKAQDGSSPALEEVIARYYPRVLKVVRMRMRNRLRWRMESGDVLQETFARAIQRFDNFEMTNEASFINWLSKIAERTIGDFSTRESAQKRDVGREVSLQGKSPMGETQNFDPEAAWAVPLDRLVRGEEQARLEACIQQLDDPYRELLILRNFIGLSFAEIAKETGRPSEGAARMMHAKAMRDLAQLVEAD